jgi:D-aspartate ligase
VIEPTVGRTDWQEVATLNGINIPFFAYCDLIGLPHSQPARSPRPIAWRESWHRWRGRSALKIRQPTYDGYWRAGDPMPSLAYYVTEATKVAGQMTRRFFAASPEKRRKGVAGGKQL